MAKPFCARFAPLALSLLLACHRTDSDAGEGDDRVCPTCVPFAGGQTGDFGGNIASCWLATPQSVPEDIAAAFALSEAQALEGNFETSLRWKRTKDGSPAALPETQLRASLTLGKPELRADQECSLVFIPLTVTLETADGSVAGELTGSVFSRGEADGWYGSATRDLSAIQGTLELDIDPARYLLAELYLSFHLFPDGPRGDLGIGGTYYEDREAAEAAAEAEPRYDLRSAGGPYDSPVHGEFPADSCGASGMPIAFERSYPSLGMRSVNELLDSFRDELAARGPVAANWRDGSSSKVTLTLGDPAADAACSTRRGSLWFPLSSKLSSDDGRVDQELEAAVLDYAKPDGIRLSVFQTSVDSDLVARLKLPSNPEVDPFVFAGFVPETLAVRTENCLVWPEPESSGPCWKLVPDP